jgi:hypothetical protein
MDAALQLIADRERAGTERLRQSELALQQAHYEETHARGLPQKWGSGRSAACGRSG